jgi:hypothetical protein
MKLQYCTYENETVPFPKTVAGDNANEATGVAIRIKQTTNLNKKIIISATTIAQLLFNSGSSKYLHSNTSLEAFWCNRETGNFSESCHDIG